jgi:hypothetical protein
VLAARDVPAPARHDLAPDSELRKAGLQAGQLVGFGCGVMIG